MKNISFSALFLAVGLLFWACEPALQDKIDIGDAPDAPSFTVTFPTDANNPVFTNNATGTLAYWSFSNGTKAEGDVATTYLPKKGTYTATLTVYGKGGSNKSTQDVEITIDDPNSCTDPFLEFLTGCTSKTWKLAPEANALYVGPDVNTSWWGNPLAEVTGERACQFDDEYTFAASGDYTYDSKGEVYAENTWAGVANNGCVADGSLPAGVSAWGSGNHAFTFTGGTNPTITVIGEGAYIGLAKAGTDGEVTTPQGSVTYAVNSFGNGRMVISCPYSWGLWRFTLVVK